MAENILAEDFGRLDLEEDWEPENDYYIHFDIVSGTHAIRREINKFMIKKDAFDPRRGMNFPTDVMDDNDREKERTKGRPILSLRRTLAGGDSDDYIEFWKVRRNFPLQDFADMVRNLQQQQVPVRVRMVRIIDNEHIINIFDNNQPQQN